MAKNKYYYNGKLIRTSAHEYTHAVICTTSGKCWGCRGSYEKALEIKTGEINTAKRNAEWYRRAAAAVRAGEKRIWSKAGRRSYWADLTHTAEHYEEAAKEREEWAEKVARTFEIVELEKR